MFSRRIASAAAILAALAMLGLMAQAQFETRAIVPIPTDPSSLVVGDFNRDGILDAAVANIGSTGSVEILLGSGDGTFKPNATYLVAVGFNVVTASLRHNGILDLVTAGTGGDYYVSAMLGNGDGTFQPAVTYPTTAGSKMLSLGDFTGHGNIDVLNLEGTGALGVCNCLEVLPGNGDGTFGTPITTPVPYNTTGGAIATGDFNNDGNLDVVVAGAFGSTYQIDILLGNGDGTFTDDGYYLLIGSGAVATGYFTSDNTKIDLAVAYGGGVGVLLGNGDGTFQPPVYYATALYPSWVIAQDLDGDGHIDLATSNSGLGPKIPPGASVLKGNGDGTFQAPAFYPIGNGNNLNYIAAADLNNDGKLDLATVCVDGGQVTTLLNTGSAVFSPTSPVTFKNQLLGTTSAPQSVTLTNSGTTPMTISSVASSGPPFRITANTCGSSLAPGVQCSITAEFTAQAKGTVSGGITINDSASSKPQFVELLGIGTELAINPVKLAFSPQKVGTESAQRVIHLANVGKTNMTFWHKIFIDGADYSEFSQSNDCRGGPLPPGGSCDVTVIFKPLRAGAFTAYVEIEQNGGVTPENIPLSGTGD